MRDDIQLKIDWADKRIEELATDINAWIDTNPYGISPEIDPHTGEKKYIVTTVPEIPREFAIRSGEIVQHLRSALDYLACALVAANGRTVGDGTAFPIAKSWPLTKDQHRTFSRKIAGMRIGAIKYILRLKPYPGGNNSLWRLHALNNIDKHRLLVAFDTGMGGIGIGQHLRETRKGKPLQFATDLFIAPAQAFLVKVGQVVLVDPPDAEINENPDVRPQIAFYEVGICEAEPLVAQLTTLRHWVFGVVLDCRRFLI